MISRTRLLLDGAALLAVLALPSSLLAQEAGGAEPQQAAPERPDAQSDSGAATNPGEPSAPGAPGAPGDPAERAVEPAPQPSVDESELSPAEVAKVRRETVAKMRAAEVLHRERLAAIHRLQQLAESEGQSERLALLDKLEVKEGARYLNVAQSAAAQLGNGYKQSLMKLAAGRVRRNVPKAEKPAPTMTPEERAAHQQSKRAERAATSTPAVPPPAPKKPRGGGSK